MDPFVEGVVELVARVVELGAAGLYEVFDGVLGVGRGRQIQVPLGDREARFVVESCAASAAGPATATSRLFGIMSRLLR